MFTGACAQEGNVTVQNEAGPDLLVLMDGSSYLLDDGEAVTKEIKIGRKFIFGPDDKLIFVEGEGECKWPYSIGVTVKNDGNEFVTILGDAGYIDICNTSGYTLDLYLVTCSNPSWDDPIDVIPDGWCSTWQVEDGCWDLLVDATAGSFTDFNIGVAPCDVVGYDILPEDLTNSSGPTSRSATEPISAAKRKERVSTRKRGEPPTLNK